MQKQVTDFFEKHPEATEVHEALGYLFSNKEDAEKYIGGTNRQVITHTKDSVSENKVAGDSAGQQPNGAQSNEGKDESSKENKDQSSNKTNETDQQSGSNSKDSKSEDKKKSV
jgi:hypothetical protein